MIRSMRGDHGNHFEATLGIHTGSVTFARPSIGSWVSYGLGTVNQNLPSFVVIAPYLPYAGAQVWSSDFLPGCHQGTRVIPGEEPIPDIKRRVASIEEQRDSCCPEEEAHQDAGQQHHAHDVGGGRRKGGEDDRDQHGDAPALQDRAARHDAREIQRDEEDRKDERE